MSENLQIDSRTAGAPPGSLDRMVRRLERLWRKEARDNLGAEWAYKHQKPISLNLAAFEKGLALAKQQCADQLKQAVNVKPPNADFRRGDLSANENTQSDPPSPARNG